MDAFEALVAELLWREGYWVRTSVHVALTRAQKLAIGRPTAPRWEIDVVAYSAGRDQLLAVECKSFLDSRGVSMRAFDGRDRTFESRFKLFRDAKLRKVVLGALRRQFVASGACGSGAKVGLVLACGRIASAGDRAQLLAHFKAKGWTLWDEEWLRARLQLTAEGGYENHVAAVVAKLAFRGTAHSSGRREAT